MDDNCIMANGVKYSVSAQTQALKKGNFWIATGDVGKSSSDVYYTEVSPPAGGYTIYLNKASGGPSIFTASSDAQLIYWTKQISGNTYTTAAECLNWFAGQTDKMVVNESYPQIITDGLVFLLDSGFTASYPRTGTTWYDNSPSGNDATLVNGASFTSDLINFDNTDDYVQISSGLDLNTLFGTRNVTICFTAKKLFYGTGGNNTGDSMVLIGVNNGYNTGFRITDYNNGTPGTAFTGTPRYQFGAPAVSNAFSAISPRTGQNTFSYVCFSQSGSSITSFINGSFSTGTFTSPYSEGLSNGGIGRDAGFGVGRWGGYMSNFQIYNRALTQAEILQNYYQAPIVTSGLVFAVDAGNLVSYEPGSTSTYSLTGNISGTLVNGVSFDTANGGSWSFDGVDDYIGSIGTISSFSFMQNTGVFTISAWVKPSILNTSMYFAGNNSGTGSQKGFYFGKESSNNIWLSLTNGSGATLSIKGSNCFLNTTDWVHVVCVGNGSTAQLYRNGVAIGTSANITSLSTGDSSQTLAIGSINNVLAFSYWWSGKVSLLSIYNQALSASQVQQNYNAQKSRFGINA